MDTIHEGQQTEIAGAITAILGHLGYMANPFPYSDSVRKSVILMVSPPGEPKTPSMLRSGECRTGKRRKTW